MCSGLQWNITESQNLEWFGLKEPFKLIKSNPPK